MRLYIQFLLVMVLGSGSIVEAGSYSDDFEGYASGMTQPGGGVTIQTTFSGGEAPQVFDHGSNQSYRLTQDESSGGGYASYELPDLDPGESIMSFTATFDLLLKDSASAPADGVSFNFGDLNTSTYATTELEDGYASNGGDVLSITFDTYDNGGDTNYNRVGALVNGVEVAGFDTQNLIVENAVTDPFRAVSVTWDGIGETLSVLYNGSTVYSNDAVSFTPSAGSVFAFGARTGGSNEDVFLDNITIVTVPESAYLAFLSAGLLLVVVGMSRRR